MFTSIHTDISNNSNTCKSVHNDTIHGLSQDARAYTENSMAVKSGVFWDVTPCGSCKTRRFGGTSRLLHQGDKNRWSRKNASCNYQPKHAAKNTKSVLTRATRRNIIEDPILHSHRRENLKSYIILWLSATRRIAVVVVDSTRRHYTDAFCYRKIYLIPPFQTAIGCYVFTHQEIFIVSIQVCVA
jgi:hypothetical protein